MKLSSRQRTTRNNRRHRLSGERRTQAIPGRAATTTVNLITAEQTNEPPPPLPEYDQPPAPDADYLWTPGYWAWSPEGYYWVPGAWVAAPYAGALWTPGYWGFYGGRYRFHHGFWGLHIGFYGGVNYGFGYFGYGYDGGYWDHDHFRYNTAVNRIDVNRIHNVYARNVPDNYRTSNSRVSFNGGTGGVAARPSAEEQVAEHEQHVPATSMQTQHEQAARSDRTLLASVNHGRPAIAATAKPGEFHGQGVVAARAAGSTENQPVPRPSNPNRPMNTVANNRATPNNSVPRPPNNNTPNNNRPGNAGMSANRSVNDRSSDNRPPSNPPNMARANPSHGNASRPPQPNHSAKPSEPKGNPHSEERKER